MKPRCYDCHKCCHSLVKNKSIKNNLHSLLANIDNSILTSVKKISKKINFLKVLLVNNSKALDYKVNC